MIVSIPIERLPDLLQGRARLVLPRGTKFLSWWLDTDSIECFHPTETIKARIEHPSFAEVEPGRRLPMIAVDVDPQPAERVPRVSQRIVKMR